MMAITIPVPRMAFITISITIPMLRMLTPTATMVVFILPWVSFCRSKWCREQQSKCGYSEDLHSFCLFRSGLTFKTDENPE